jgi:hypothetical protein
MPFGDEEVVFDVRCDDVAEVSAQFGESFFYLGCQGYRREDEEGTGGEADWGLLVGLGWRHWVKLVRARSTPG